MYPKCNKINPRPVRPSPTMQFPLILPQNIYNSDQLQENNSVVTSGKRKEPVKEENKPHKRISLQSAPGEKYSGPIVRDPSPKLSEGLQDVFRCYQNVRTHKINFLDQQLLSLKDPEKKELLRAVFDFEFDKPIHPTHMSELFINYSRQYFPVDTFCWNENGDKALHVAIKKKMYRLAITLIDNLKANINVKNDENNTPARYVEMSSHGTHYLQLKRSLKIE